MNHFLLTIIASKNLGMVSNDNDNVMIAKNPTQAPIQDDCPKDIRKIQEKQKGKICPNDILEYNVPPQKF